MTTKPFFVATVDMFQPAGDTQEYELAWGAVPWGSISMDVEPTETTGTLYLSDDGYTTKSTDAGGVVVYPPKIAASFGIDRQIPLPPGDGAGSWSFGSLEVTDTDDAVSSLLRSWNIDAQNVTIKRGTKTFEAFDGYRSNRQTKGWYVDVVGVLQEAAAGVIRWDYSTGTRTLLNEAASTNHIANPRASGAVAGSPGTVPTGWTVTGSASGITRTIAAVGTDDGIPYVDIRLVGTASATQVFQIFFVSATSVVAAVGETWTCAVYAKVAAGAVTGTTYSVNLLEAGGSSTPSTSQTFTPTTADLYTQRISVTRTVTVANTAYIRGRILVTVTNGATIDVTIRVGAPQMEKASAISSVILPEVGTPAVTSRDMERLYTARKIWTSPALASLETVFTGVAGTWIAADRSVVIPIRDISYWLERPIQSAVYGGTGTYDGTAELAGVTLPKLRGKAYNIAPVLIDPTNLIYQYNDAAGTVVALYERGATGASGIVFQANTTDLYTGTTTAGQYRTDNSRGLFQLGSPPVGQITLTATGQFSTAGNITNLASIARYLQSEDAAVPSGFMNTTSYSDAATAYPYAGGIYIAAGSGMTARAAVAYVMASFAAKMIVGRDGRSKVLALRAASLSATPTAAINEYTAKTVRPIELPSSLSPPPYRIRVAYQHNYTIQTDASELATDTHREFIAQADRFKSASNAAILAAYRRPNDLPPFGGGLDSATDAATVASEIEALWCTSRSAYLLTVPMEVGLGLDIGQTVLLTWPSAFLRLGQRGLIVSEQFRSQEEITFMVLV
jgi:hypothetical protein